jgi:23S rRNA maturation mini-RNase III
MEAAKDTDATIHCLEAVADRTKADRFTPLGRIEPIDSRNFINQTRCEQNGPRSNIASSPLGIKAPLGCALQAHAIKAMVQMMAVFAEMERDAISKRTKEALAAAKARGVKLGNPRLAEAIEATNAARRKAADAFAASGVSSLRGVAKALSARGIKTARGGAWTAVQVGDILRRERITIAHRGRRAGAKDAKQATAAAAFWKRFKAETEALQRAYMAGEITQEEFDGASRSLVSGEVARPFRGGRGRRNVRRKVHAPRGHNQ